MTTTTHTAPLFTPAQCVDAINRAGLTPHQHRLIKNVLDMRQGTAEEFAERLGSDSYQNIFNSQLGAACHKLADALGWQRGEGRHWVDLILCFENAVYRDGRNHSIWSVRGNWIGAIDD